MIKEILTGVAAGALLVSPAAFAQSLGNAYGQPHNGGNIGISEQINPDQLPAESTNAVVEVQVPETALERLAGKYIAHDKSVILVTRVGGRLAAHLAGISLEFAPSGPNEFFIEGSPLTLSFAPGDAGKAQGLTVKENGMVIMQASASR